MRIFLIPIAFFAGMYLYEDIMVLLFKNDTHTSIEHFINDFDKRDKNIYYVYQNNTYMAWTDTKSSIPLYYINVYHTEPLPSIFIAFHEYCHHQVKGYSRQTEEAIVGYTTWKFAVYINAKDSIEQMCYDYAKPAYKKLNETEKDSVLHFDYEKLIKKIIYDKSSTRSSSGRQD